MIVSLMRDGVLADRPRRVLGQHGERTDDTRVPVTDELPRSRNSDEQRDDQGVAEYVQRGDTARIRYEDNPGNKFRPEYQQQQVEQAELPEPMMGRRGAGKDRPHRGGGEQDAGNPQDGSRPPDASPRREGKERDCERVNEGQQRRGRPDLLDDSRTSPLAAPVRHRHGDEQQARQRTRGGGDRREKLPVSGSKYHALTVLAGWSGEVAEELTHARSEQVGSLERGEVAAQRGNEGTHVAALDAIARVARTPSTSSPFMSR